MANSQNPLTVLKSHHFIRPRLRKVIEDNFSDFDFINSPIIKVPEEWTHQTYKESTYLISHKSKLWSISLCEQFFIRPASRRETILFQEGGPDDAKQ